MKELLESSKQEQVEIIFFQYLQFVQVYLSEPGNKKNHAMIDLVTSVQRNFVIAA